MIPDITYFILDYNPRCKKRATSFLNAALLSLHDNRNSSISSETYIIDQGNKNLTYKKILATKCSKLGYHYVGLQKNLGISGGINFAAQISRSPYLCLVTSDTVFTPGLDSILLTELEKYSDIYQITPSVDRGDVPYQVNGYTQNEDPIRCIAQELTIQCWKKDIFETIGFWDERWIACYESLDYPLRIFLSGFSAAITHKIACHHEHNTTYHNGSLADAYGGQFDHGPLRMMWNQKWPGLDWNMMYDLSQYTEETRRTLVDRYLDNIRLVY